MRALYLGIEVALLNRKKFFRFGSFQISISPQPRQEGRRRRRGPRTRRCTASPSACMKSAYCAARGAFGL